MNATIKSILSIFILTIFGALCMPALAAAAPPSGRVTIVNANSGLCLTIAGGGRDNNAEVVQYPCDDHPSRFWSFTVVNGDIVAITNLNSGLCLTIAGGGTARNTTAVQYPCDDHPSRRWRYTRVDERTFRLVNVNSDLCLTIAGGGPTETPLPSNTHATVIGRVTGNFVLHADSCWTVDRWLHHAHVLKCGPRGAGALRSTPACALRRPRSRDPLVSAATPDSESREYCKDRLRVAKTIATALQLQG